VSAAAVPRPVLGHLAPGTAVGVALGAVDRVGEPRQPRLPAVIRPIRLVP